MSDDPAAAIEALIAKLGDPTKAVSRLYDENFKLRAARRNLKKENDDLKVEIDKLKQDKGIPADKKLVDKDVTILEEEQAEQYAKYVELGTIDEIEKKIGKVETLEKEISDTRKKESIREVSEIMGWNPPVLMRLGLDLDYKVEEKDKTKTVLVKDGEKFVALSDYADKNWEDFLPSLKTESGRNVVEQAPGGEPPKRQISDEQVRADQDKRFHIEV